MQGYSLANEHELKSAFTARLMVLAAFFFPLGVLIVDVVLAGLAALAVYGAENAGKAIGEYGVLVVATTSWSLWSLSTVHYLAHGQRALMSRVGEAAGLAVWIVILLFRVEVSTAIPAQAVAALGVCGAAIMFGQVCTYVDLRNQICDPRKGLAKLVTCIKFMIIGAAAMSAALATLDHMPFVLNVCALLLGADLAFSSRQSGRSSATGQEEKANECVPPVVSKYSSEA